MLTCFKGIYAIPVLSNVLLEATADGLRIVATDLNLQIGLVVPANVETEGSTTVSAQLLHSIVRELAEGSQVELALREGRLNVTSGRSRYKLATLPANQFPAMLKGDAIAELSIPASDLLQVFQRVGHPDRPGGSHDKMAALNAARDAGLARFESEDA